MGKDDTERFKGRLARITNASIGAFSLNQIIRRLIGTFNAIMRILFRYVSLRAVLIGASLLANVDVRQIVEVDSPVRRVDTLRQVHVLFRHGERMPTSLYPTDPNKPSDFKDGLGRVTTKGKRDMYAFGEQLRNRYKGFLTDNTNEVKARSSGRDRCLESMQAMLAALYEPKGERKFQHNLNWQPVPVATMPVDIDGMLYEDSLCKKDDEAIDKLRTTGEGQEVMEKYKDLMNNLEVNSGKKMKDWVSVRDLLDTLQIERRIGLKMPKWLDEATFRQMEDCAKYTTLLNYKQDERIRFRAGLLLKDMSLHFNDVTSNSPKHKIYTYGSHDVLIAAYLSAFGVFNGLAVPPSAAIVTELHEDESARFYVQTFFRNDTETATLHRIHIPGCDQDGCLLPIWQEKVSRFIPDDWREECGEPPLPVKLYDSH